MCGTHSYVCVYVFVFVWVCGGGLSGLCRCLCRVRMCVRVYGCVCVCVCALIFMCVCCCARLVVDPGMLQPTDIETSHMSPQPMVSKMAGRWRQHSRKSFIPVAHAASQSHPHPDELPARTARRPASDCAQTKFVRGPANPQASVAEMPCGPGTVPYHNIFDAGRTITTTPAQHRQPIRQTRHCLGAIETTRLA